MALLKQSTTYVRMFLMVLTSDHVSPATGKTVTVNLSKAGAAFGAAGGAVAEIANGWYKVSLTTTDTNTLNDLAYNCTASLCDPTDFSDQVIALDVTDAVRAGLTSLANAAAGAVGGLPTVDATNSVKIQTPLKKNTAITGFMFQMFDSTGALKTTLTITSTVSIDGAAFGAATNSATEVANGWYKITLAAADVNGTVIALRFAATGAVDTDLVLLMQA